MPLEMPGASRVAWVGKEKWGTIKPVPLAELFELCGCGLFAQHRDGGVPWNELNKDGDERNNGPDDKKQDCDAP